MVSGPIRPAGFTQGIEKGLQFHQNSGSCQRIRFVQVTNAITPDLQATSGRAYGDWLGVVASIACAIHCAAMPFVVGFLPLLGLSFLADPSFHKWMVGICLLIALLAFVPGWRRHGRLMPAFIAIFGLSLISLAAFAGPEDCCPTPCGDSSSTVHAAPMATMSGQGGELCVASCCPPSEEQMSPPPVVAVLVEASACEASCCPSGEPATPSAVVAVLTEEPACAASCCPSSEDSTPVVVAAANEDDAACGEACCPTDAEEIEVETAGFMALVWLIMTPLGGLVLVAGHLCNRHWSCRCAAGCCSSKQPSA